MFEIKGNIATAICYATVVEDEAIEQIRLMCDQEFTRDSKICIMPDVHTGKGCTIGTTMTVMDKVVPNVVGVDIGCGMYTVNIGQAPIDLVRLDEAAHYVPSGMRVWEGRKERFDLQDLRCYRALRDTKRLERSLGTLGGGNHFIEVDRSSCGTQYLVIHTGSRNLGKQVAEYYQNLAIDLHKGKEEYFAKKDVLIAEYKAAGRRSEIEKALKDIHWNNRELQFPEELCYLYGIYFDDYLHDVEEMILRKGAISAQKGERVLIPINMRDGSILACGKGNPDWNYSAPHGAGRVMSRSKARATLDLEAYRQSMEGVYTTSVNSGTLDEAPMAYKSLADIAGVIGDTVEIIDILKPIYNFKASEEVVGKRLR